MKLYTYRTEAQGADKLGVAYEEDPEALYPLTAFGFSFRDMNDFIVHSTPAERALLGAGPRMAQGDPLPMNGLYIQSPIPQPLRDVLCLGVNYAAHADESGMFQVENWAKDRNPAIYFTKHADYCQGSGAPIPRYEGLVRELDYECELAVIIGKDAKNVSREAAADYVFGYTILNDISARDLQRRHHQWFRGKSLDGHTPLGPCILTADEVAFPPVLSISSAVNGETRQNSSTALLIASIPDIIAELSSGMTLRAGTIIATGTPDGVGMGFDPPRYLNAGDEVACTIEKIGTLVNRVE